MMKMEQEVLEIPEFSRKFTEVLYGYQQERHLCDCLIITTNGCIPAHRLVLVMTSPYFHQIQSKRYIVGCTPQDNNFTIPFKNEAVQTIIRLLYTGKLFVSKVNILQLVEICSFLKLKEALSACIKYVEDHSYHGLRSVIESAVSSRNDGAVIPEESNFHKVVISRRKVDRGENLDKHIQMKKGRNLMEKPPVRDISSKSLMVNGILLTMDEDGRLVRSRKPVMEQHQDSQKIDDNDSGSRRITRSTRQKYASSVKCKSETVSDKQKKTDLPMSQTLSFQAEMSMMQHSEEKSNAVNADIDESHTLEENTECSVRKESKSPKFDKLNVSSLNSIAAETAGKVSEIVSSEHFTAAGTVSSSQSSESVNVQEKNSDSKADQVFSENIVTKNEFSKEAESKDSLISDNVKKYNTEEQRNEDVCANGDLTDNVDITGMEERSELADNVRSHNENSQGGYSSDATILSDVESSGDEWSPGGSSSDDSLEGKNTKKRKQPAEVRADVKKARVDIDSENSTSSNSAHLSRNCSANKISQSSTVSTKHSVQQISKSLASLNDTSSIVQVNESSSIQQEKFDTACENESKSSGSSGISTMSSIDQNSISASDKSTTQQKTSNNEDESAKEEKITYACYVCKKEFDDPNLLIAHRKEMHPPKPYSRYKWFCDVCPYKAVRSEVLAEHKFKKHNTPFDEEEFELHKCHYENCDYSSLLKSYLFEHIRKVHEHDGVKSAICEVCGKGFRDKLRLKRHMEIHRNKEDRIVCTCSICGKGFVREMILEVHMKNVHLKQQEIRLCHLCPYSATTKISLANHLLKVHEYVHKDYKVHKCNKCDFQAIANKDLTRHMKFHESDGGAKKKYKCYICEKRFACTDYLQSHLKRHRAETLYCEYEGCSYSTKRSFLMKAHVRGMHTDVDYKPFKCHLCDHRCKLKGNLNKHIEGKHKVKVTTLVDKRREALDTGKGFFDLQKEMSTKYSENVIKNALVNE